MHGFRHRRDPGPKDVKIEILYCGVCHSDLHQARDEWHNTPLPSGTRNCRPGDQDRRRSDPLQDGRRYRCRLAARAWNNFANGASTQPTASPSNAAILTALIGGMAETQEMLDFCAEHQIVADVEIISIQKINEAYERMLRSDVKYRFSIDMSSHAA
jgi:D-arabinose 1-dehydrogenase-like Zn-dependent alcohol dehydrogenase